jgi:hypothetical protein
MRSGKSSLLPFQRNPKMGPMPMPGEGYAHVVESVADVAGLRMICRALPQPHAASTVR